MGEPEHETNRLWTFREGMLDPEDSLKGFTVEPQTEMPARSPGPRTRPARVTSYLVVNLSHHLHETRHVLPAAAVERISKSERKVWLRLTRADVESAPEHHDEPSPLPQSTVDGLPGAWSTFLLRG